MRHRARFPVAPHRLGTAFALASAVLVAAGCGSSTGSSSAASRVIDDPTEAFAGGDTTVFDRSDDAFGFAAANLAAARSDDFFVGNSFFRTNWVSAPSSTTGRDGLGPLFNARSCSACHLRDGRGAPPSAGEDAVALLLRVGTGARDDDGSAVPDPLYGGQIQNFSVLGVPAEGQVRLRYSEIVGHYADGTAFSLRDPSYGLNNGSLGALSAGTRISPRVAPAVFGLGLLEAIPEDQILGFADPDDENADGISGRANLVPDRRAGRNVLGRFGWKAEQPTVEQQSAAAFVNDIGLTSDLFPQEICTSAQIECQAAPSGGAPEVETEVLAFLDFYMHTLAVPGRRNPDDSTVRRGKQIFFDIGCESCHVSTHGTDPAASIPELAGQTIHPYTDLLLHDLGPELGDDRPSFEAEGNEWRTPPLWGLGLVEVVNGHTTLLHDGRARDVAEAILWHGGEGQDSRDRFVALGADDRNALLRFLEDL